MRTSSQTDDLCILAADLAFPEGPVFDDRGRLWLVEIHGGTLCRLDADGLCRWSTGGAPNGLALDGDGRIWICDAGRNEILCFDEASGAFETACREADGRPLDKPNDLAFDAAGNLVFTCPGNSREKATGYVCARRPDGTTRRIAEGLFFPNGLAFSEDGQGLFIAETYRQRIWKGGWDAAAADWQDPVVWADVPDGDPGPDGMAFGVDGTLWVAVFGSGKVMGFDAGGVLIDQVAATGRRPTNCAFHPNGGLVVTEAERGRLAALPHPASGIRLFAPRRAVS